MIEAILDALTALIFVILAGLALREWARRRGAAELWLLVTFGILAIVTVTGVLLPERRAGVLDLVVRAELLLLVVLPFSMYRFACAFSTPPKWLEWAARALTAAAAVAVLAAGDLPDDGGYLTPSVAAVLVLIVAQWLVLLSAVAVRLWQGGQGQPPIARRRMRLLSLGSVGIAVVIVIAAASSTTEDESSASIVSGLLTITSALAFFAGYLPPPMLRAAWRANSQEEIRNATIALMATSDRQELSRTFLPHIAASVGARAAAMRSNDGTLLGTWGITAEQIARPEAADGEYDVEVPFGTIIVWTTPYTPFFGAEEIDSIRSLGVVIELALERYEAIAQQKAIAERLVAVNQLKNEFVAVVAHDLRSPMSVISGFARTLGHQWELMGDAQKREILTIIAENTESLAVLVEDVLQVARMESGDLRYDMQPFDIVGLASRIVRDFQSLGRQKLRLESEAQLPQAHGDQDRIWQVLTNLVTNAMKFSDDAEVVEISVHQAEGMIKVSVRDRGIGIEPEDQAHVFDKFSRIESVDGSQRVKGTGLGLYICQTVVRAHGGELTVDSNPGEGSTFAFTIPAATESVK